MISEEQPTAPADRFRHGGNVYESSPAGCGEWLDLSANINPMGMPASVRYAIEEHIGSLVHYPEPDAPRLTDAIGKAYSIPKSHVIPGNGAAELIYLLCYTLRPKRIAIPVPSFSEYERAALASGAKTHLIPLSPEDGFAMDWAALDDAAREADCIIIGNPNNPTGTLLDRENLERLARYCAEQSCWLVVDESFMDFLGNPACCTVKDLVGKCPTLIVLHSLTKFYAIPGLRLGFGVAPPALRARMELGKDVWNVNTLAQMAGIAALSDTAYADASRRLLAEEQAFWMRELPGLPGIFAAPPTANFLLLRLEGPDAAKRALAGMRARGILLRDCSNYPGLADGGYLRMAIRTRAENVRALRAWKEILGV